MKRIINFFLIITMGVILCACGQTMPAATEEASSWQEQYDLGVRYLSEGNYEEAIIAFMAAIEIDPKRVETYEKLADTYLAQNDVEAALKVLNDGVVATESKVLQTRIDEMSNTSTANLLMPIEDVAEKSISISNKNELEAIQNNLQANYHLTNDIDLSGAEWMPIEGFEGTLDGQGHVIKGLTISGEKNGNCGLFGEVYGAVICNLGMEDILLNITASDFNCLAGAFCGFAQSSSEIRNCYSTGEIIITSAYDISSGGICGGINDSTLADCYNKVKLTFRNSGFDEDKSGMCGIEGGGICGAARDSTITRCYNLGTIYVLCDSDDFMAPNIGGICGSGSRTIISLSSNSGVIEGSSAISLFAGGICGAGHDLAVEKSSNNGNITALCQGMNGFNPSIEIGGICGYASSLSDSNLCYITDCYNMGNLSGSSDSIVEVGGICGSAREEYTISRCYNIGGVSGEGPVPWRVHVDGICGDGGEVAAAKANSCYSCSSQENSIGTPLSDSELQSISAMEGFDFNSTWAISAEVNGGYPYLKEAQRAEDIFN